MYGKEAHKTWEGQMASSKNTDARLLAAARKLNAQAKKDGHIDKTMKIVKAVGKSRQK